MTDLGGAPGGSRASGSVASLALAVGLAALLLTAADVASRYQPSTWIQRDGRFYTNVNVTLVESGSVDQGEFAASWYTGALGWNYNLDAAWSNVALGRDGEHLPKHPILMPLLSTPLFWAFGLLGTLMFNVLLFSLAGGAAFVIARRDASDATAVFCALALLLATGIRDHAYDYHVDVLILGLFATAMAVLLRGRGLTAGLLLGLSVVCRPTMLLWLPSLALLVSSRRDRRTLGRALIGGTIPLVLFALSNAWLYGAPWWTGYNRVLIVENGTPTIANHTDAFGVPLREGLRNLWEGPYGVRTRLPLVFAAVPGLLLLARRRPRYVVAAILGVTASVLLFAKYRWYGDRFLWPSVVLLLPALAATFETFGRALRRRPEWRPALVATLGAVAAVGARAAVGGPIEHQIPGGDAWDLALHLGGVGAAAFGMTRAAQRFVPGSIAPIAPIAFVLFPGVAERAIVGGHDLSAAALLCLALGGRHWLTTLGFAAGAAWTIVSAPASVFAPDLLGELDVGAGRAIVGLLGAAVIALPLMRREAVLLAPLALLAVPRAASLGGERWPLFAIALLCLPLPRLVDATARALGAAWARAHRAQRIGALASLLVALALAGLIPRLSETRFRIASYPALRAAKVRLGDVPCDFLAWEHLNWECSTYDPGVHGETGLATSAPLHVAGREEPLFLITTQRGLERHVRWESVTADETLTLRYAVPDELGGGGTLRVEVDGTELASLPLPREREGRLARLDLDTRAWRGRAVSLELTLSGRGAAVLVDGAFGPEAIE